MEGRMNSVKIYNVINKPTLVQTVLEWHKREWPKPNVGVDSIKKRIIGTSDSQLPVTLVAVDGTEAVGFVSMIFHAESEEKGRPHWIDAVYVELSHRNKGVASLLIRAIQQAAIGMKIEQLHALTEIPILYEKNGWGIAERIPPRDFIMNKMVSEEG